MTPAAIIHEAAADGVVLRRSASGGLKATGEQAAVTRWLPVLRKNKPAILAELENSKGGVPVCDPAVEARRRRVLWILETSPGTRYAVLTDLEAKPGVAVVALAIRGRAACELNIPRDKYDGVLLLDWIEKYGFTVH